MSGAPNFIVIGAQKSASTFLQNSLQAHPDIFLPDGETPYFENPDYDATPRSDFAAIFAGRTEKMQGIKRPNYLGKPEVPPRIHADFPAARLLAVLRNPIDRAVAAYFHQIKYGTCPALPLEQGMTRILDRDPTLLAQFPRVGEILEFGFYHKYLSLYQPFFDKGAILILLHDDIVTDAAAQIRTAYRFLGVGENFKPPATRGKPQKVIYSTKRLRFLSRRNRFLYSYNADRTRLEMRPLGPLEFVYVGTITAIDRFLLARFLPATKPKLSPQLRRRLAAVYADDINRLSALLNRDLSFWISGPTP